MTKAQYDKAIRIIETLRQAQSDIDKLLGKLDARDGLPWIGLPAALEAVIEQAAYATAENVS